MSKYTFTLQFPSAIEESKVTLIDFQVTGDPSIEPPLAQNQMPDSFEMEDTLTFTYQNANPGVEVKSCLLTQYNIKSCESEETEDFINVFDKPISITEAFRGSWIFHLLGLYKSNNIQAAFYLDPEFTAR